MQTICKDVLTNVQKIPADSQYRINVEKWFKYISKVLDSTQDIKAIEDEIGLGQIEELIEMGKDELNLVDYYTVNKGWERVKEAQEQADALIDELADTIYFSQPEDRPPKPVVPPPGAPPAAPPAPPKK